MLAVASLGPAASAVAQEPPPKLPPVVVETTKVPPPERTQTEDEAREELQRVPGSTEVVGQRTIEESRAVNLKDVLDFVPGVLIRPRFGAADESQLSIRGSGLRNNFHLRGVNVLIDGFIYGQADGFSDFESLELLTTKRLEVYKGANALALGGYTLGGAINLVTKTGYDAGLVELRIREHSEQVRRRAYATLGYSLPGGATLRLDLGFTHNEEQLPGSLTLQELRRNPRQQDPTIIQFRQARNYEYTRGGFTLRTPLSDTPALEWKTQLDYQELDHPLSFAVIAQTTYNWGTELRYILTAPLFDHGNRLTAGIQYSSTRQNNLNLANNNGHRGALTKNQINVSTNVGGYAEEQFDLTKALTAVAGGRANYSLRAVDTRTRALPSAIPSDSVDFFAFTPKLGFVWKVAPMAQVFGNASRSYEPPLMLELTAPGQLGGPLRQLQAQTAWQFEVGTRGALAQRVTWDLALYDIELTDEIRNVNVRPFPGAPFTIPRFQNIDRSRHTGVEAGLDVVVGRDLACSLGLGSTGDALTARAAYTFSRFVFVTDDIFGNNDLPGAPRHFIRSELRYDHLSGAWLAPGVEIVPTGYFVDSANTVTTPNYALFNIRAGWDHEPTNLGVFFEARNLTNKTCSSSVVVDSTTGRFFEPGDGRALYGGVEWRWK
jgi:iron complex outermembrane recepter protein